MTGKIISKLKIVEEELPGLNIKKNEFEYINCNLCNSEDYDILYESTLNHEVNIEPETYSTEHSDNRTGRIVKCKKCGLVYINPMIKSEIISENYKNVQDLNYISEKENRTYTFKKKLNIIETYKKNGKLLDVGCSFGLFLSVASENNWDTYGVEISKFSSGYAKTNLGLNVVNSDLFKAEYCNEFFDIVTLWDTIEHLPNPSETLLEINRILKVDGIICVDTPNIESLLARILKRKWFQIIRCHVYYFSKNTLEKILEKSGFEVIKTISFSRRFSLESIIKRIIPYSKFAYDLLSIFILKVLRLGNLQLSVNLFDCITVFARKKP